MEFIVEYKKHVLRVYNNCEVQQVNDNQMQKLLHKQAQEGIAQLCSLAGKEESLEETNSSSQIAETKGFSMESFSPGIEKAVGSYHASVQDDIFQSKDSEGRMIITLSRLMLLWI
ncbi:uncharacterized protein LOC130760247 isoform X2 [Actinidia eriantha]|uniref:uncharacterized protein LOC130760247 isoform X2 n=1 Tax=Actinidia eriantha TaxID=165200 RepID=UPI002583D17E|nr:uncharacterized protein LOC130760247 isoform X2 [Actinidia eriantha]